MEWLTPLEHALPRVCYYAELGCSTSRGVKTNRGEPKIGERLAAPAWDRGVPAVVIVRGAEGRGLSPLLPLEPLQ